MYQLITNEATFPLDTYIWFRASTFYGDIKAIEWYVIHDSIACYSLWFDAIYFELQRFSPFHCSSSVRTHHICSNLAICIAIIFHSFCDDSYIHVEIDSDTNRHWISNWYRGTWHICLVDILLISVGINHESYYLLQHFALIHLWWVVTFTGAIHFSKCSHLP